MNSYFSNAELKDKAKEKLTGHFGFLIGCTLLSSFLTYIVSVLFTNVYTYSNMAEFALGEAISFLVSLFTGVLNVGLTLIYLKTACGSPCSFSDLFSGYRNRKAAGRSEEHRNRFNVSLGVSFFRNLLSLLPGLAYAVPLSLFQLTGKVIYLYVSIGLLLVATVIYLPFYLMLSQCLFIMLDFPDKSVKEVLQFSVEIMKGQKKRLFVLILSFIPITLLACLSLIGVLWLIPYVNMTYTIFYLNVMQNYRKS